jgi:hypothetical protein
MQRSLLSSIRGSITFWWCINCNARWCKFIVIKLSGTSAYRHNIITIMWVRLPCYANVIRLCAMERLIEYWTITKAIVHVDGNINSSELGIWGHQSSVMGDNISEQMIIAGIYHTNTEKFGVVGYKTNECIMLNKLISVR